MLLLGHKISEARLEKATLLLQTSQHSLQKVADDCGYASVSSLSHAFTKNKGMPPSEFRKQMQAKQCHGEPA